MANEKSRRFVIVCVTEEFVGAFLFENQNQNAVFIKNDLPEDVELCGVQYNYERGCFDFRLWHDSFEEVKAGNAIPIREVVHSQYCIDLTDEQKAELTKWHKE